jgi:hypothetical protein
LDLTTPKEHAEQMVLLQGEPAAAFEWFKVSPGVGNHFSDERLTRSQRDQSPVTVVGDADNSLSMRTLAWHVQSRPRHPAQTAYP